MIAVQTLRRAGRFALDLVYPPRCVLCGRGGFFLCEECTNSLPRADGARCHVCWLPLAPGGMCHSCLEHPLALSLRSAFRYEGAVRQLVHAFKFRYQSCLGEPLARAMLANVDLADFSPDAVTPVPLTRARQRERGFNQSRLLAERIAERLGAPVRELLTRDGHGRHQARAATAAERWQNVQGVFRATKSASGLRVLLIDDLATTGATLDACARALLAVGAASVSGLTLARED